MPRFAETRRAAGHALIALALLGTAGCVRIGSKAPERLLTIASAQSAPAGIVSAGASETALVIEEPSVPKALATLRVAVRDGATSFAYVKDAQWVDTPARQFQALLSETVRARGDRLVLDPARHLARPGEVLQGDLVAFGIDAVRQRAVVTYDATMVAPDGRTILRQRFTAEEPVRKIDADTVAPAISTAANRVATDVASWIASLK